MLSRIQSEACLTNLLVANNLIKLTIRTHLCSNNVHNITVYVLCMKPPNAWLYWDILV